MTGGGEAAHVGADLGDDRLRAQRAHPGGGAHEFDGDPKGGKTFVHLPINGGDRGIDPIDLPEMQLQQEPMMAGYSAAQRFAQFVLGALHIGIRQLGQLARVAHARHYRAQYRPSALAQHGGEHRIELDIGVFQGLVDALGVAGPLAHKLLAGPQQGPQLLRRSVRHEARADQAVRQQLSQPSRIVHVGLAPWHVLHVRGVRQDQLEIAVRQHMPDRLPIHARRFHRDMRAPVLAKPVRQLQKTLRGRLERLRVLDHLAFDHEPHACNNRLLVNVQPCATLM